jgi:hypothetical protein
MLYRTSRTSTSSSVLAKPLTSPSWISNLSVTCTCVARACPPGFCKSLFIDYTGLSGPLPASLWTHPSLRRVMLASASPLLETIQICDNDLFGRIPQFLLDVYRTCRVSLLQGNNFAKDDRWEMHPNSEETTRLLQRIF